MGYNNTNRFVCLAFARSPKKTQVWLVPNNLSDGIQITYGLSTWGAWIFCTWWSCFAGPKMSAWPSPKKCLFRFGDPYPAGWVQFNLQTTNCQLLSCKRQQPPANWPLQWNVTHIFSVMHCNICLVISVSNPPQVCIETTSHFNLAQNYSNCCSWVRRNDCARIKKKGLNIYWVEVPPLSLGDRCDMLNLGDMKYSQLNGT